MANDLVRFATGLESNLSSEPKQKGKVLFAVTGDNKGYIYFDKDNSTRIKMSEHALTAEKDAANNTITTTYLKQIAQNASTSNTFSIKSLSGSGATKDTVVIPNASTTVAGLVTAENQTFAGQKTFNDKVIVDDTLTVNEGIISLAGEPYMAEKEYTNILCTANNDPNGYLYYGQLKLKDYYTEWYLKMYISMDIPYDSTKANTNNASYEGIVEYWGYANTITAYRIFNAHASTSYKTFYSHQVYRTTLAGYQTYGNLLGFRFYSSWNPASTGYERNIKIKVIHTDNCSFNFLNNMVLYTNAPGTGSTNFTGRSEYDGWNNGLRESGDDNTRNHLIGAQYLKAGESCIDRYTIVMQEKGGDFSSICYKSATSNINDTATDHIKSTSHYVVGGPVYYAYSNAHTNAGALSSSQEFHTNYPIDFRYSSNAAASLTNGKMVYLKFEKDSEGYLTIPDHPWYSQTLPTEEDGYVYMSLGIAYSTSSVYMFPEHEYYEYIAGQIRKYVHNLPVKQGGTGKTSWTANQIVYASAATTLSQLASGTDGQILRSKGANAAPIWMSQSDIVAGKATGDSAGDNIRTTYIKGISVDGTTLTITKGDNSTSTLTLQDTNTDTKVTNTLNTTAKAYITGTTSATTNTGTQVFDTGVYLDTTAGQLVATTFKGNLAWTYLTSVPTLVKSAYGTAATDKYTIQLYNQNGAAISSTTAVTTNGVITIPAATTSQAGLITSTDQSIAGSKTFTGAFTTIGRNIIRNTTDAPDQGDIILSVFGYKTGYPVYTDPLFESGVNSVSVYNNSGNGNVTITRDTYTNFGITSPGTNSNYVLRVQNVGTASPNLGGFYQTISSRANAQFVQIFRALVPVGYTLYTASNSMGTDYKDHWITSNVGTGKWEWYARRVLCGKEGTFSSGGHVSISGTPAGTTSAPVSFYLSYCQLYDLTKAQYDGLRTRYADNADNATLADKATKDSAGNQITTIYLKSISITGNDTKDTDGTTTITAGSKGFYTVTTGANASTKYALPIAGTSVAGIVTNTAQTFAGAKTFNDGVTFSNKTFNYSGIEAGTTDAARVVWFADASYKGKPVYDNDFTYNPATNTINATNFSGLAAKATGDGAGNTITTTYLAKIAENSSTINSYSIKSATGANINGTKDTITIPNASTTKAGLVTGEAQTLGGDKTFNDEVIVKDMLTAEADIISANGYSYIKKKTFTNIIATANNTANGCFYLADITPNNFYEPWNFRAFVHAYVPGHPEYNGLYDITVTGYYAISSNVKYWNVVYSNFNAMNTSYRPIYYSGLRTLNETGYNANSPILWGVDLYASTNPTAAGYERTVEVVLIDTENCTFDFRDTPIKHADVTNTSHYYTNYSMDCCNNGLRESSDNDTYDRTYATNYVRVGSSPIHRYSLIMQDTTDGFSSLVYKTKNSNDNDNAASGHVAATDVHFIPTGQILWNSTGSWYNTTGNQTGSIGMYTAIPFDFRYASNCSASLTIGKPVYYIFNKNTDDNTLSIDSAIHTQTLPTTEDGKVYMFLGIAYATTHIYLHHVHPMYEFVHGKLRPFREVIPIEQGGTGKSSWTSNGLVYASGSTSLSQISTGTDGQLLKSKGANAAPEWTDVSNISVNQAEKDGAGNVITTHYVKHGSIEVSDTNHNMTYQNGASGDTKTVSLPFVKLSGDTMTGDLLVQKTSGDTKVGVKNTNGNVELLVSTNRGVYDRTSTSWMIYRAPSGAITYLLSGTGSKNWQFNDNGNFTTPGGATATANMIGTASRAVGDSAGNQITTTYLKSITITGNDTTDTNGSTAITAGSKGFYTVTTGANSSTKTALPIASASVAGIVVNTAQTWAGVKTFSSGVTVTAANSFNYSGIATGTSTGARPVWYSYLGSNGIPVINASKFTYEPTSDTLKVGNVDGLAAKATADGAGDNIRSTYAKAGSFTIDTANHKVTYTDGAGTAKEFSTPFVLCAGDSMTGNLSTTGNMTAIKFIGALQGNADSASTLTHKTLNGTTISNTAGSFAFSGSGDPWSDTDWVGLQIGDTVDKFQITANDGGLLFRQNDSGGTASSGWTGWTRLAYTPSGSAVGTSTKPVYVTNKGAITACDYELKATVNNATQWGVAYYSTTTNITSTAAGGANTALMGKGSAAPAFISVNPTLTLTAGTTAGPKVKITVLGVAGTDLQLPSAGTGASGVVTTDTQTFAGGKTFNNPITANATGDSPDSLSAAASLVVKGGVSVAKNLSAKTIRIDNNQTTEGVQLQYNETLDTLNFVFV